MVQRIDCNSRLSINGFLVMTWRVPVCNKTLSFTQNFGNVTQISSRPQPRESIKKIGQGQIKLKTLPNFLCF